MAGVGAEPMSPREAEVLDALRDHLTNAQIGQRLHISVRTVESHVSSLLRKLGAADRRDLVARAAPAGEGAPPPPRDLAGLPGTWTTFVGRALEIEELAEAIAANRLVTLVGPGGVGKTRLAVAAAGRVAPTFPAGGAFVDLVPVGEEFVVQAIAAALGVVERSQESLGHAVHERLRAGRVLLVLDNCEHLLSAVAHFTRTVLESCPEVVVLATSRQRLALPGERVMPVAPLALTGAGPDGDGSEAEGLFRDRAASAGGIDADPTLIAEICRRLDGMPLAIELAAARSSSLGLDGLLAGLDDHMQVLSRTGGPDDRHRSLRAVIEWSHQLLDDDEQAMFRRLGVFAGAFDLVSAAEVAADGEVARASDLIGRLADKSLLVRGHDAGGSRWRMLDTVRAYARDRLETSGERAGVRGRHFLWAAATADRVERSLGNDGGWQGRFDAVADDLRAALLAAEPAAGDGAAYELALRLGHLTYARRFLVEARDHFRTAVARAPDERSAVAALRMAADATFSEMRGEAAYDLLRTAHARASAAGDRRAAAIALAKASAIAGRCPALFVRPLTHEELVALVGQAQALAPPGDPEVDAYLALAAAWDGARGPTVPDPARAEEALAITRRLGDPVLVSSALDAASSAVADEGRFKQSWRLTAERLSLLDRLPRHDPRAGGEIADVYHMATESALAAGELRAALASARSSFHDDINQGLPHFAATHLVIPLALQGAFDEALVQSEVMRGGWERAGRPAAGWMAPAFFATALVLGLRGQEEASGLWWEVATRIAGRSGRNSFGFFARPRVALHLGAIDRAREAAVLDGQSVTGMFGAYARVMSVEVAVVAGAPDAGQRLIAAGALAGENDFVAAQLLRAAGRLHGDPAELERSVSGWEAIGARFERACTLLLLPARAAEGAAELAALGCPLPPR